MILRPRTMMIVALGLVFVATDANAIIGMPLTPMSYAGVARRTVRRASYAAAWGATSAATVAATTTAAAVGPTITTLPPACAPIDVGGVVYQQCGASYYRPYYQGTGVVYATATP